MSEDKELSRMDKYLKKQDPEGFEREKVRDAAWNETKDKIDELIDINVKLEKENQDYVKKYLDWFIKELNLQPDVRAKLQFTIEQENSLFAMKQKALAEQNGFDRKRYEKLLDIIVKPWKAQLKENLELEKEGSVFPPVQKQVQQEPVPQSKPKEEVIKHEPIEEKEAVKTTPPLLIPDKRKFTETGRRMEWSDPRIPELLAELFFQKGCIFENQKQLMQEFLTKGSCPTHIAWRKKGNILATAFYDLKRNAYLRSQQDYIAEKIEQNIFSSNDTLKPIGTKATIKASFSPGPKSLKKRAHRDDPDYLDVISYLQEKLQSSS